MNRQIDLTDKRVFSTNKYKTLYKMLPWERFSFSKEVPWKHEQDICARCGVFLSRIPWTNNFQLCGICSEEIKKQVDNESVEKGSYPNSYATVFLSEYMDERRRR